MLAIDREAARQRKRAMFIESLLLWIIGLAWLSIALGILLFLMMTHAAANSVCLTKKEARHLWPRSHLYWYSKDRCWSNRRGPPRNLKFDPIFSKAHAEAEQQKKPDRSGRAVIKIVRADQFNELDAAADANTFFDAKPFPFQQYVLDLSRYRDTSWHKQIWGLARETK